MYTHICISSNDLDVSQKFYDAALTPLGIKSAGPINERACMYSSDGGTLLVIKPADEAEASYANGGTIGFAAADAAAVDAFHAAGLANGGTDEGAPGKRPQAPGNAYGAYLRDPVGNKICAFCQLPEGELN
ncbi:MAG: glyoxalase [SAR86 cluster bacterium]|uniref:Glyoxalase n=1 Tax=SAR86 cluster bacterium TaxID=2030880 RepID=A0A2A5CFH3_9GAMM|nr:VOC family protein [Gammaproteobacteria bacterium AH-315-E17]PCJ42619.1 MAG: glyoxalase [SAR86 cluster bacterium]